MAGTHGHKENEKRTRKAKSTAKVMLAGNMRIGKAVGASVVTLTCIPATTTGHALMNASRSALIVAASVVGMPWGNPL